MKNYKQKMNVRATIEFENRSGKKIGDLENNAEMMDYLNLFWAQCYAGEYPNLKDKDYKKFIDQAMEFDINDLMANFQNPSPKTDQKK